MRIPFLILLCCAGLALSACKREERNFQSDRGEAAKLGPVPLVDLEPGGNVPPKNLDFGKDYEQTAYHLSQGKALFSAFNCNGCHSNGGGGMGPALMDDVWIYGSDFVNIAASIRDGRPNGMPSFGRLLPAAQIYELAAYVRSLGGFVPTGAAPSRNDSLEPHPAENRMQNKPELEFASGVWEPSLAMKAAVATLRGTVLLVLLSTAGCAGQQSALQPGGPEAAHLVQLFWIFTATCGGIWIMVIIGLCVAISRQSRDGDRSDQGPLALDPTREQKTAYIVGGLVTASTAILIAFTILSYFATRRLAASGDTLNIEVTAHQWWWEVTYSDKEPSRVFQTANEINVPVGRPVKFTLNAADVIHSFWIPNLGGKQDLIPGQVNTIAFTPDHAGVYRGQCAEFCGLQHAHMALFVIAQDARDFESWRQAQLRPAASTGTALSVTGQQVFFNRGCALCHTIRGTSAGGRLGPDLTHLATRKTIAAGTLPTSPHGLSAWLADPQGVKPGNKMPDISLQTAELTALESYLESLQ